MAASDAAAAPETVALTVENEHGVVDTDVAQELFMEIYVRCHDLVNLDTFSLSDPQVKSASPLSPPCARLRVALVVRKRILSMAEDYVVCLCYVRSTCILRG